MAKVCKNLKELEKELQEKIDIALLTDVAQVVTEVMQDHIAKDVYEVYSPKMYERRLNENGLLDEKNINSSIEGNTLIIENNTLGSSYYYDPKSKEMKKSQNADKEIAGVIESGRGYDIHSWGYDEEPRPFIENTREELRDYEWHKKALKQGLQKQGLEVK